MNTGIKRIGKGLFAIFMIKLTLFMGVLIFQSCQKESDFEIERNEELKQNFLTALYRSNEKLREIKITPSRTRSNVSNSTITKNDTIEITTFKMCLLLNQDTDSTNTTNPSTIDTTNVDTVGEVFDLGDNTGTRPVVADDVTDQPIDNPFEFGFSMCFDIPQEPTQQALDPAIQAARSFLLSRDLTDADIVEALDGADESVMIPFVHAVLVVEAEAEGITFNSEFNLINSLLGIQTANAQSWGIISGCAVSTLGLDSLTELRNALNGKKVSGKALKKAFKKVAKQFVQGLSGWGTILLVIEFGICVAAGHAF
jgi:hypothetical protein